MIISDYGTSMSSLYLTGVPSTAAAYCAHKNKRNSSDKNVVNYNWCLPGIRQLEGTLTANYNRFAPIRDGAYYWSSATGKNTNKWLILPNDDDSRARATSAYIITGTDEIDYAPSDINNKYENSGSYHDRAGGSALRTVELRIRAIYHPTDNQVIDGYTYRNNASQDIATFITNYPQN